MLNFEIQYFIVNVLSKVAILDGFHNSLPRVILNAYIVDLFSQANPGIVRQVQRRRG